MKNRLFLFCLMAVMAVSCVKEQQEVIQTITNDPVFHATIENADTRVFADDQLRVLWNADDRVSIFNKTTFNRQYRFTGEDGANAGSFIKVPSDDFVTSNPLDYVYSVYPYNENTCISNDGEISVYLPAEQTYREDSFGLGANTMIAITEEDELMFKNLCGYFAIKLYGDNVSVSSITLKGNNNELLAGKATVVAQMDAAPTIQFDAANATKELTLTCPTPVTLGTTAETATTFWFVIPPTTFERGITLTVTDDNNYFFEKVTSGSLEIKRNTLKKSSSLQVVFPVVPDAVDLGLSVKWASFNLGASAPEEYGDYYAWGETEPYYESGYAQSEVPVWREGKETGYSWDSYKWYAGNDNGFDQFSKYIVIGGSSVDGKMTLDLEDDAAHVSLGGTWRMPTSTELLELKNNCTIEWITVNGVYGCQMTSKVDGYTDKSIFFPSAGYRYDLSLGTIGAAGDYWSSSLYFTGSATYFTMHNMKVSSTQCDRDMGLSIRPVCE